MLNPFQNKAHELRAMISALKSNEGSPSVPNGSSSASHRSQPDLRELNGSSSNGSSSAALQHHQEEDEEEQIYENTGPGSRIMAALLLGRTW